MKLLKLFQSTKDKHFTIEHMATPPISSVFLMVLTAMIGVINIKAMLPNSPDEILFLPFSIVLLFGIFHPRWVYLSQILLIDLQAFAFARFTLHPNISQFIFTLVIYTVFAVALAETGKYFWDQAQNANLTLRRLNNFVDDLEDVLFNLSRDLTLHESAEKLLNMCRDRLVISGAYVYEVSADRKPVITQYSSSISALAVLKRSKLIEEGALENIPHQKELLNTLNEKDYLVLSLKNRNKYKFSRKLFDDTDVVSLIIIGLRINNFLSGFILLADDREILDSNSLDQRIVSMIRSIGEIHLSKKLDKKKLRSIEDNNLEFTKLTMLDTKVLIDNE